MTAELDGQNQDNRVLFEFFVECFSKNYNVRTTLGSERILISLYRHSQADSVAIMFNLNIDSNIFIVGRNIRMCHITDPDILKKIEGQLCKIQ